MAARLPYPVRWWYSGYRDGYVGIARGDSYFASAQLSEVEAYEHGRKRGREECEREAKHHRLIAVANDLP